MAAQNGSTDLADAKGTGGENRPSSRRITVIVANRYTFEAEVVTGQQIKETADIPAGFALYRRTRDGNESISDDDSVELHDGDHFFARPLSDVS